ncbi:MAG: diguanylate cyclase [Proteobacteria bacterium]|nr:diguanylate cyclase [Pseudomonadota bacterium]
MKIRNHIGNNFLIDLERDSVLLDAISNGVTITDQNSSIIYTNAAFTKITGYSKEEAKGQNPGILHSGRHNEKFFKSMWKKILTQGHWEGEIWNRRKSGEIYPEFLTISKIQPANSTHIFYIGVFSDISFLKKDLKKNLHLAFYDPLTHLPNRNLYLNRISHLVENKRKPEIPLAVFYMDLDKFKQVNDTYGHCVGDKLLAIAGKRLASTVRKGDTIARAGGDEFTAILTNVDNKISATQFAQRILETIEKPFLIDEYTIHISISIGISFYPGDADSIEDLLTNADKAMYKAKKSGTKIAYSK